jgi:hypothetical protein
MKKRFISLGCWIAGVLFVLPLYAAALLLEQHWIIIVAVVVAALDAKWVRIWRYKSDIAQKPSTLFILMLLLGWLILPWYVGLRLKIIAGVADLKDDYKWMDKSTETHHDPVPPAGLVQPWSARWRHKFWGITARK